MKFIKEKMCSSICEKNEVMKILKGGVRCSKKQFLSVSILVIIMLSFIFIKPVDPALETPLLVDVSPSSANVPYQQTDWYGFTATGAKGYCVILAPSTGNADLYLFDTNFNQVGLSKNTGTTQDKVWYGQSFSGPMHIGCYGVYNPSSNFTIQVITAPYVKTLSPTSGGAGTLVTLTGFGFGDTQGTSYVKFGTVTATNYSSWTNTQIKVYVPSGVAGGVIRVVVYVASKASNPKNFTVSGTSSNGTMWRYNLARTGNYPNGPTALPLNLKWSYSDFGLGGAPVIANNIIYLPAADGYNYYLYAIDANNGTLKWKYRGMGFSPAAVANGIVYTINSADDKIYALDANTGSLKWSYQVGGNVTYLSSPLVVNGIVYAGMKVETEGVSNFYALDANTGVLKWSYNAVCPVLTHPAFANNLIYITPEYSGRVIALDANTGALKWTGSVYTRTSSPVVYNGVVYVVSVDGPLGYAPTRRLYVFAFNANTGALQWKYLFEESSNSELNTGNIVISPAISGNTLYFGTLKTDVYAFDLTTKSLKWRFKSSTDPDYANLSCSPTFSNNIIYVGSGDGKLYALDASTGVLKWSYNIGTSYYLNTVAVANGKIYVVGPRRDGYYGRELYCFGQ